MAQGCGTADCCRGAALLYICPFSAACCYVIIAQKQMVHWMKHARCGHPGKDSLMRRIFLFVLDSFGIGELPDAAAYGDSGANTLRTCAGSPYFSMPNMQKLGLFNIDGVSCGEKEAKPLGSFARLAEKSCGKDTTTGHWEIGGIISEKALPTYPEGFPEEVLDEFSRLTGRGCLCNRPYSGTEVIKDYGDEHVATGKLIVYTSADSVFQVAAHEDVVPLEQLYEYCRMARKMLQGKHGVGRVIARPFTGTSGHYARTPHRHDFSLEPTAATMLDQLTEAGKQVIAVGKIHDIFAGRGMQEYVFTESNEEGIEKTIQYMKRDFDGLCFINLVDYDMLYGHRRDIDGYARALSAFDKKLPELMAGLHEEDLLMMTADHGCDPGYLKTTDHTREYIPFVMYGKNQEAVNFGTRDTFSDIGATVLHCFGIPQKISGTSML